MASLRGLLIVVGLVGVQLLPDIVIAQTTTADTDAVQLQEVVVTAEKRTSTVQQTPLSLTAITGAELSALGMSSAQDILRAVPGLSAASAGPGQASYEIRGIAATGGNSPTVGFYLDDIAITPPVLAATGMVQIDPSLYDLERVEVLRGPQGTLYGASAMGGAIKLITNQPNPSQFDGSARVTLSGTEGGGLNYGFNAMVNLPINQYAAIRIVGTHEYRSGWIDRIVEPNFPLPTNGGTTRNNVVADSPKITIPDVNDEVVDDYRASLLFAPTDDFKMTPMIMYQEINMGGYDTFDDPPGVSEMATYQPFNVPESFLDKFIVYSLPMTYSFDTFSATSESGYWSRATNQWQDDTEELQALFQFPGFSTADGGAGPMRAHELDNTSQFSEELRFASSGDGPFQWTVGGYYAQFHYRVALDADAPGLATVDGGAFGTSDLASTAIPFELQQEAAFGNASYKLTRKLRLEVGLRYFLYQAKESSSTEGIVTGSETPTASSGRASDSGTNPMVDVSYSATPDVMLYARAAKGFRVGGPNYPVPISGPPGSVGATCLQDLQALGRTSAPSQFGPDSDWNYELGEKGQFFDRRLIVDSDVYYIRWSGVQEGVALSCGFPFTANATTAAVKGGESEIEAKLFGPLTLIQSVGYSHAAFTANSLEAGIVNGQPLFNVPLWTLSTTLQYQHPIGSMSLVALITHSFSSSIEDLTYEVNRLPSREEIDFRIGLESAKVSVFLYVDNALNRHNELEDMNLIALTGPTFNRVVTNQPLTGGVQLEWHF